MRLGLCFLTSCVFLLPLATFTPTARADSHSQIRVLSSALRKRIADAKIKSLAVADFAPVGGASSGEGLYFADILHLYLAESPKKYDLIAREAAGHFLETRKLVLRDLESAEVLKQSADSLHVEALLTGSVAREAQQLILTASLKRSADGSVIASEKILIPSDSFFDSLRTYPLAETPVSISQLTDRGVRPPEFLDVPAPQFRGPADGTMGVRGDAAILLNLVVSAEGRVTNLKVVKGAGPEFADVAWCAMRAFRFRPALDRTGKPVAVVMPMQVFFSATR
ncbi:MAG TPA: energy transducer TonB [Candidatus Dormibacteraeota bacterium]|nr:energy transducer TonB [Candidatus Dormibacteraeota bacterium]